MRCLCPSRTPRGTRRTGWCGCRAHRGPCGPRARPAGGHRAGEREHRLPAVRRFLVERHDLGDEPRHRKVSLGKRTGIDRRVVVRGCGVFARLRRRCHEARQVHAAQILGLLSIAEPAERTVMRLVGGVGHLVPQFLLTPRRIAPRVVPIPQQRERRLGIEGEPVHHRRRGRVGLTVPAQAEIAGGCGPGMPRRGVTAAPLVSDRFVVTAVVKRSLLCARVRASVTASASAATAAASSPASTTAGSPSSGS